MTMPSRIAVSAMCVFCSFVTQPALPESRLLECISAFPADTNHQSLAAQFGAENVRTTDIDIGEGMYERGTTIYGDSDNERVDILWKDPKIRQYPSVVRILGNYSRWTTDRGLSLGQGLASVQRLNGRPFSLLGFGFDYGGTQISWSGGALEAPSSAPCKVRIRFRIADPQESKEHRTLLPQIVGDRELMSDHPALKALNPKISSIWLDYGG